MPRMRAISDEVLPPSRRTETAHVLRAAAAVVVIALLWIGGARRRGGGDPDAGLSPYQVRFADLAPSVQRVVRELQEGMQEAMRLRADEGRWPEVARLAAEGIPPFADDGVERGQRRWSLAHERLAFQYLGTAAGPGAPSLLLTILEPGPGDTEGRDPRAVLPLDEQHQRLRDGTLLHVAYWVEPSGVPPTSDALVREPAMDGWRQVLSHVGATPATASVKETQR